jgi:HD-like signal output (HDOD) protein
MTQKHILLADADANALEEFRQALGEQWIVKLAGTGAAALEELKRQPYDGLVASLYLPDLGTAQFLNKVRGKYPKTVRFVVASEKDRERVVKEVLGAHQFLIRPFDADGLRTIIERALAFDLWMESDKLHKLVARMRSLPTVPALYLEIVAALKSPDSTTEEVGEMISKDMAITTKLLQVINSAYFGLPRTVTSAAEAVGLLGFETVKSMVMAVKLLNHYDRLKIADFSVEQLWKHSTEVAHHARKLVLIQTGDRMLAEEAFTAGLMHDVGKAVLAANFTEQYHGAQSLARKQHIPMWEVEKEIFGASHGEVGAYLLGLWGLPLGVLEAAALHHQPARAANKVFTSLTAVHAADVLQHESEPQVEGEAPPNIDVEYLAEIGMLECLPAWREEVLGPEAAASGFDDEEANSSSSLPHSNLTSAPPPAAGLSSIDGSAAQGLAHAEQPTEPAGGDKPGDVQGDPPSVEGDPDQGQAAVGDNFGLDPGTFSEWQTPAAAEMKLGIPVPTVSKTGKLLVVLGVVVLLGLLVVRLFSGREAARNEKALVVRAQPIKPVPAANPLVSAVPQKENTAETPQNLLRTSVVIAPGNTISPALTNLPAPEASSPTAGVSSAPSDPSPQIFFPDLKLQGILFSPRTPSAIINGILVHTNDLILEVRVLEIRKSSVLIEFQHRRETLSLE